MCLATWDDAPHLDTAVKKELWESIPPYQRDARSKGIPQLGAGAIYPVSESEITCAPFQIPKYWPRAYGMDVGWERTSCIWGAIDQESETVFLYSEHHRSQAEPPIHAAAVRSRGDWIPGVIDPSARGRSQVDGRRLIEIYSDLDLFLQTADNAVEAGILAVWERLSAGRLKVFSNLQHWLQEYRIYRRDEKGRIIKKGDHLMDATRYLIMSGLNIACTEPVTEESYRMVNADASRSSITGY